MDKKLLCVVLFMMLLVVSIESGPPFNANRVGKRDFQAVIKKREYCARARQICSPAEDDLSDDSAWPDF